MEVIKRKGATFYAPAICIYRMVKAVLEDTKEEIPTKFTGEKLTVGYNAAYLKDILSHMNSSEIVIRLNTPISASLFYPTSLDDNVEVTMLLMPIRLND